MTTATVSRNGIVMIENEERDYWDAKEPTLQFRNHIQAGEFLIKLGYKFVKQVLGIYEFTKSNPVKDLT